MVFRFRKSIGLLPGVRLNLSNRGTSVSLGPPGLRYTIGRKGTRFTAGIAGTGLSVSQFTPYGRASSTPTASAPAAAEPVSFTSRQAIESAPPEKINELSTSELAPILHTAQRRFRFARFVVVVCLLIFIFAWHSSNELLIASAALMTAIFLPAAIFLDRYRRSVTIDYQPDEILQKVAVAIDESIADLKACHFVWNISARGRNADWKRNAGATRTLDRQRVYAMAKRPACIRGTALFPSCTVGKEELYFLPDVLLVVTPSSVAALQYRDFSTSLSQVRFIEEETVPRDASVIGHTWRYVNKNGGPDRRFASNRQIPICLYGELSFSSPSGLNEVLQFSNPSAADRFVKVIEIIRGFEAPVSETKSIKSWRQPSRWPSVVFWALFLVVGLSLSACVLEAVHRRHDLPMSSPPAIHDRSAPPPASPSTASATVPAAPSSAGPSRPPAARVEYVPIPRPRPMP